MVARGYRPIPSLLLILGLSLLGWGLAPAAVRAAGPDFGSPTIEATFGRGIDISQPVQLDGPPARVELLLRYADDAGPLVIEVPPPATGGALTLKYSVADADGHILPNTAVEARWRITATLGEDPTVGPAVRGIYADDRFDWQTVSGDIVRVHWYAGGQAFGRRALQIGEDAVAETGRLLGVTEERPVDFFIYADEGAFYDALGPGTRENVGGQAVASIRTLFARIGPNAIDDPWVGVVVPHELVHLVVDTAASNPYHFPPRWLNEGLAVYLSQGYDPSDRRRVEAATSGDALIPLAGLSGQFPTSADQFFLAYAESVSAVDYLIRTHDQDALVSLIRSYADGRTDDEAFTAAIGMDLAAFDAAWLADLGAATPTRYGPQPAPPGSVPAAWVEAVPAGASATPAAATTSGPGSGAQATPVAGGPTQTADGTPSPVLILVAIVAIGLVGAMVVDRARRRANGRRSSP